MTENRPLTAGQKKWLSTGLTVISLSAGLALNANILKAQAADQPATAASSSSVTAVTASESTTTDTADKTKESTATETDSTKTTEKQSAGDEDAEKNQSTATDEQSDDKEQSDTESQPDVKEETPAEPVAPQNLGPSSSELNDDEKTAGSGEKVSKQPDQTEVVKKVQTQQVKSADNDKMQTVSLVETTDEKINQQKFLRVADSQLFSPRLFLSRMNVPITEKLLTDMADTSVDTPTTVTDKNSGLVYQKVTSPSGDSYTVTGYTTGSSLEVTIPDTFDGAWVTAIGDNAFAGKGLTSVTFGANITSIGNGAFQDNSLTSVTLPDKLGVLGKQAFEHNMLKSITFGAHTTAWDISDEAFANNQLKGTLVLPDSVTVVGSNAFAGNAVGAGNQLTGLTLGPKVTTISTSAFANNKLTGDLSLPNTLTTIDDSAFANNNLTSVELGTPAVSPDGAGPQLTTIGDNAFANNQLTGELTVPDAVTTIGKSAFAGNGDGQGNQLTSVTFSGGQLEEIFANAFMNNNLGAVSFTNADKDPQFLIDDSAFAYNKNLTQLNLNEGLKTIGPKVFIGDGISDTLKLPNSLDTIGVSAFQGNKITDVKFGSGSRIIGNYSFADNPFNVTDNENTLIIPDSVTTIGDYGVFK